MEKDFDKDAYAQSYVIISFLLQTGEIVVSEKLMNKLESNKNPDYKFNINDINKISILPDTEKILTYAFLECMINAKEKQQIYSLVSNLRSLIINEKNEEITKENVLPMDLATLKWSEKFKIAIKKLLILGNPINKVNKKLAKSGERML